MAAFIKPYLYFLRRLQYFSDLFYLISESSLFMCACACAHWNLLRLFCFLHGLMEFKNTFIREFKNTFIMNDGLPDSEGREWT